MGGGSGSRNWSKTNVWGAQSPFLKELYGLAQNHFGGPAYEYGQGRVTGTTDETTAGQNMIMRRGMAGGGVIGEAENQMNATLSDKYLNAESNPWLGGMYDAAASKMGRHFNESVVSGLNSRFAMGRTQQDRGGNAQTAAMGRAQSELAGGLGDLANNMYGGAYNQERGRQMQAMQMAPQMEQAGYLGGQMMRGVGAEKQGQNQKLLDDLVARFNFNQYEPAQRLAEYSGFIGAPVMEQEGRGKSSSWNLLSSDHRLKKRIERTGTTASGIPTYTFEYRGDSTNRRYSGVIAQDLLDIAPDAVATMDSGFLGVNYDMIDADFKRADDV